MDDLAFTLICPWCTAPMYFLYVDDEGDDIWQCGWCYYLEIFKAYL